MSQFRLRTSSGDALCVPEDAEMTLFLDEDGFMRMRTEVYVDSVDIGLMTSREPDSGPAPTEGPMLEGNQCRLQRLQHCSDEGSKVLGHAGCPCAPLVEALSALGDPEALLRDCSGVDISVFQPFQDVEDLVVAGGESLKLLMRERVKGGDDFAQLVERVGGLSLHGPKVLDLRTQLGDLSLALRVSLALVSHDSSSVGGDEVEVGAPASLTGSGASEPTEEVPAAVAPVSSGCAGCCGRCGSGAGAFSSPASDPAREVRRDGDD